MKKAFPHRIVSHLFEKFPEYGQAINVRDLFQLLGDGAGHKFLGEEDGLREVDDHIHQNDHKHAVHQVEGFHYLVETDDVHLEWNHQAAQEEQEFLVPQLGLRAGQRIAMPLKIITRRTEQAVITTFLSALGHCILFQAEI